MGNIIEFKNVTLNYGQKAIFSNVSFNINRGDFVTIMGANGSGKSCLAGMLYGLSLYSGTIKYNNKVISEKNSDNVRENISIIFENSSSFFMSDNVINELTSIAEKSDDIDNIVKKIGISKILHSKFEHLSCGEKQLVLLACALVSNPKVLVLDGALNMLDNCNKNKIVKLLKQYNKKGLTIINITQNCEEMLYGGRVILLDKGRIVLDEPTKNAIEYQKEFSQLRLGLPFMADLCVKLKYYNVISKMVLDKIKLVKMIWK